MLLADPLSPVTNVTSGLLQVRLFYHTMPVAASASGKVKVTIVKE
jgi:hypothetical protein